MRDTKRIKPFLESIGEMWEKKCPDWRFGQLMVNFIRANGDPFYWEEEKFIEKLKEYLGVEDEEEEEEEEPQMMKIQNDDGTEEEVEVVVNFQDNETGMEYIVYTKNETDANGEITLYASKVHRLADGIQLGDMSDEEWEKVQDVLNELKKG